MDEFNQAIALCLKEVRKRDRFPSELVHLLCAKGFSEEVSNAAVERLVARGVVSADRAAEAYLRRRSNSKALGDAGAAAALEASGVSEAEVQLVIQSAPDELERARAVAAGKFPGPVDDAKLARFLYSRGFSEETITSLLESR